jgi:hypothetical protein
MSLTGRVQHVGGPDHTQEPKDAVTFSGIRAWLPFIISIIVLITSMIVGWEGFDYRLQAVKADETRLEITLAEHLRDEIANNKLTEERNSTNLVVLAEIRKDIAFIRLQLEALASAKVTP